MGRRRVLWVRLAGALGCGLLLAAGASTASARAQSYADFHAVRSASELTAALAVHERIFLAPGRYAVANPIRIDRDSPLVLHGAGRRATRLVPRDPTAPLFELRRAPRFELAGLRLEAPRNPTPSGYAVLAASGTGRVELAMHDVIVEQAALVLGAAGRYRLQAVHLFPKGRLVAPIVLDHPDASLVMVGGNISNMSHPPRFATDQSFHVWAKRGRLQMFGTGLQATNGVADLRIDGASSAGPHVIANVRSEGNNGARRGAFPATLLRVPRSTAPVDVILVANAAAWAGLGQGAGRLVDYGAAGTVWLLGNNGAHAVGKLVVGEAPGATVVAVGNLSYGDPEPLSTTAQRVFARENLVTQPGRGPAAPRPRQRFAPPVTRGLTAQTLPAFPAVETPTPLRRPRLDAALPGMLDAKLHGARGDGVADDTAALQQALDAGCSRGDSKRIFLPAGTYRVTRALRLNHRRARCRVWPSGGWIAGAGANRTVIRRVGSPGPVFETEGLAYATVQGLAFETTPFAPGQEGTGAAFSLENAPGVGHASQGVTFTDVRFRGGRAALGIGLASPAQCSENLVVDGVFRDAAYGLGVGGYNALANLVLAGRFEGNGITLGHPEGMLSGGTWSVLGATVRSTRRRELGLRNSATGVWYLADLDTDTPTLVEVPPSGATYPLVFERLRLLARAPAPLARFAAGGGLLLVHSRVRGGALTLGSKLASSYAVALESEVQSWTAAPPAPGTRIVRYGTPRLLPPP